MVTDLTTCHNTWFHPDVDRCFVPTEFARSRALKMGLQPQQVTVHGLPIRPAFSANQQPKAALRKQLGMDGSKPAVLLVGESYLSIRVLLAVPANRLPWSLAYGALRL